MAQRSRVDPFLNARQHPSPLAAPTNSDFSSPLLNLIDLIDHSKWFDIGYCAVTIHIPASVRSQQ